MSLVFLGLGSNLGRRMEHLYDASVYIRRQIGDIVLASHVYESDPWGFESKNNFLNQVLKLESDLTPELLMEQIKTIEMKMGREQSVEAYSDRVIDIDLLFYEDWIIATENLQVPHPHLHLRKFVLLPLSEIAGDLVHPLYQKTISIMLSECVDQGKIRRIETEQV